MPTEEEIAAAQKLVDDAAKAKEGANKAPTAPVVAGETAEQTIARLTKEVESARAEAGKERVNAKTKAAEEATTETLKKVGVALGLIVEENPDPVKLLAQVQEAQGKAKFAEVQLAIFHAADAANANARALLDSRSFLEKVAQIDTSDSRALTAVIEEAVAENPSLARVTDGRAVARPDFSQGSSGNKRPVASDAEKFAAWWNAPAQ